MPLALRSFGGLTGLAGSLNAGSFAELALAFSPPPKSGSRNPATDFLNCADSAASLAIDVEVAVEPSAVCDEISRTTCMFFEILPDAAACWRALAEMFCTRLAI